MSNVHAKLTTAAEVSRVNSDGVLTEKGLSNGDARELVFGRYVIEPNVNLAAHIHSADTIAYCIKGSCSFRIGEDLSEHIEMGPGDYVFIAAGTVHTEETGDEGVELVFARDRQGGQTQLAES